MAPVGVPEWLPEWLRAVGVPEWPGMAGMDGGVLIRLAKRGLLMP